MSNIPAARQLLRDVLPTLPATAAGTVARALDLMTREPPAKPRAPARKRTVTPADAAAIRAYCARHPEADLQDVAQRFGVNIGRVSEVLHGRR